jgi:methanogenesis imperfect marker protein 11
MFPQLQPKERSDVIMVQRLSPEEVTKKYGKLFCRGIFTLVDEKNGVAQVIEECSAKGPVEWDACNRKRAGGAITNITVEGNTIIMDTIIGEGQLHFGPASKDLGGQGLRSLVIDGDQVRTTWVGLAGASVGVGACMPQGPGTIATEYQDDVKIGGAHQVEVTVITPKLIRAIISVDDTDTKEKGASWSMMLKVARECPVGTFLQHKIIQLNPNVPQKTTNCSSSGVSFAVKESELPALLDYFKEAFEKNTYSQETTMACFVGLRIPKELEEYGWKAKSVIYKPQQAMDVAERTGVQLFEITGKRGTIGAVAAIGCFDLGLKAAGLPEDFES